MNYLDIVMISGLIFSISSIFFLFKKIREDMIRIKQWNDYYYKEFSKLHDSINSGKNYPRADTKLKRYHTSGSIIYLNDHKNDEEL